MTDAASLRFLVPAGVDDPRRVSGGNVYDRRVRDGLRRRGWEVDVFEGRNAGLIIAEVELAYPDQPVALPAWVGREITTDERYGNSTLAAQPAGSLELAA